MAVGLWYLFWPGGCTGACPPSYDLLLRKACGWTYKPTQSASTVGRFRSWYETSYSGRRLDVLEHIGRGNTKRQGRESIRVGFTWDETARKVIVGFVGQHQRNRGS